jgi:hypothetical protein
MQKTRERAAEQLLPSIMVDSAVRIDFAQALQAVTRNPE